MEPVTYDNSVAAGGVSTGGAGGKWKWYAIGAVLGVALIVYMRKKQAASASTAATSGNTVTDPTTGQPVQGSSMDTGAIQSLNGISDQLSQLLSGQLQTNTAAGNTQSYPNVGAKVGSGYSVTDPLQVINTPSQGSFMWIQDQGAAAALQASGNPLWFQPQPGVFQQFDPTQDKLVNGTYLFEQLPSGITSTPGVNPASTTWTKLSGPIAR